MSGPAAAGEREDAPQDAVRRVAQLEGERAISPVAGRLGGRGGKAVTLAALVAGGAVFVAATWSDGEKPKPEREPAPARQVVAYEGPEPLAAPRLAERAEDPNAPSLGAEGRVDPAGSGPAASIGAGGSDESDRAGLAEAARRSPLLAWSARGGGSGAGAGAGSGDPVAPQMTAAQGEATELERLRRGSAIGRARAARLADRSFLILAGTSLPCILQTAMDSSTPGYVTCVAPRDVYSDNGAVVLMEKGTRVLGEYRSGMRQGQNRLFVLWTRAVTPGGVAIDLSSPASDSLGRAGFGGAVDSRFWQRFGGALLLTIVDGGMAAAADDGGGAYGGVVRLPSDAAGIALQNSVNIPPTLRKAQGSEVSIFVAQDLDFAGVYGLSPR